MPSSRRQKTKAKARPARPQPAAKRPAHRPAPARAPVRPRPAPKAPSAPKATAETPTPARPLGRVHVLSLSFVRDGDEFMARLETDGGQITELKNRSLDQLLTLVASELEDLLE
ncbi:MAG TPA: hypothetical protein VEL82_06320 [Thermoplasmata archaeon]|nr:hypothetical protein [Thermoplasmata archaeon]